MKVTDFFIEVKKTLLNSYFVKNSLLLISGTTIAQIVPLLIYPILGRIYAPDQFAFLASFSAVVAILSVFSTGKYEMSILIAEKDEDAANIVVLSLSMSVLILIISILPLIIFNSYLESILKSSFSIGWILLFAISAFSINVFNCYNEWCVRNKLYKQLSLNKMTNSFLVSIGKLITWGVKFVEQNLTLGDIIGRVITAIICIFRVVKRDLSIFKLVSIKGMLCQAKRFKEFPLFTMPAQLLNTLGASIPILMIRYFYDNELGYYSMAYSVMILPVSVVSYAVRDVFRQKAYEEYKLKGSFNKLFVTILKYISIISIVVALIVYPFLPEIFSFVLGDKWLTSGCYAQILLPMIVVDFIAMSISGVLTITENLKQALIWQIYFVLISIVSIFLGGIFFDNIESTLSLFSFLRLTAYLYLIIVSYYYSKGYGKKNCLNKIKNN